MHERLTAIYAELNAKQTIAKKREYDFFFIAPLATQEMFYQYWIKNKDIKNAPQFLKDFEQKNHSSTQ
jgi:hypothetical protein